MGILGSMALVGNLGSGWAIGLVGWLVLRLIGRLDAIERTQAETCAAVDALAKRVAQMESAQSRAAVD